MKTPQATGTAEDVLHHQHEVGGDCPAREPSAGDAWQVRHGHIASVGVVLYEQAP